ncbi:MAG: radical SAM protein [Elusimicrobiaceae bacterium]|nr:radical SAM protein [Elusimicrobiaceae bacterium]
MVDREFDVANEESNYVGEEMQHKYEPTLVVISSEECLKICEWCFRGRLFQDKRLEKDKIADPKEVVKYAKNHPELRSILFTGGDSFLADKESLRYMISEINKMDHIISIRFGTRAMVHQPELYYEMKELIELSTKVVYFILHIIKPEEVSKELCEITSKGKYFFLAQSPLLKTLNADSKILMEMYQKMSRCNINPYYMFHCRPVEGNQKFVTTFKEGYEIVEATKRTMSGINKRFRYSLSCDMGKLEVVGIEGDKAYLRFHQAKDPKNLGKIITTDANAIWLVDGEPMYLKDGKYIMEK